MNITATNFNAKTNYTKSNINFKGEPERKLFQNFVERKIQSYNAPYTKFLKETYEELIKEFRNKYGQKFKQAETIPNEFVIKVNDKNSFKVSYQRGMLSCTDKSKSFEKRMGKLVSKNITNGINYETASKNTVMKKNETVNIVKNYAKNETPFNNANQKQYDSDLKFFI